MPVPLNIVRVLLGALLLVLGRKLFWLFVAIIGFVSGYALATRFLANQPDWVAIVIGIVVGVIGALLAVFLQRVAIAIAGFLAGGYLLLNLLQRANIQIGQAEWLPYVIGGIIGAVLMFVLFDWALILLSSVAGANLIVENITIDPSLELILLIVLIVVGVVVQAGIMYNERRRVAPPAA